MYLVSQWRHNSTGLYRLEKVMLLIGMKIMVKLNQGHLLPHKVYQFSAQIILLKNN